MSSPFDPSAWRGFPPPRVERHRPGRPRKNAALNQFYGYPVELIADWCCISFSTAHGYKTGRLKPSRSAQKLFRLYRDRMVLTPEWKGWVIKKDCIVDPEDNETDRQKLRNVSFMVQYFKELARRSSDPREMERLWGFVEAA